MYFIPIFLNNTSIGPLSFSALSRLLSKRFALYECACMNRARAGHSRAIRRVQGPNKTLRPSALAPMHIFSSPTAAEPRPWYIFVAPAQGHGLGNSPRLHWGYGPGFNELMGKLIYKIGIIQRGPRITLY